MMSNVLLLALLALAVIAALVVTVRMAMRSGRNGFDAGAVSTRWLSELRRDEPWITR